MQFRSRREGQYFFTEVFGVTVNAISEQYQFLLRLLFDEELREQFAENRSAVFAEEGLSSATIKAFSKLDIYGLNLDAQGRKRYIMNSLCRSYPITSAAIGSLPNGPRSLSSFLKSSVIFQPIGQRNLAYGRHLKRLITLNHWGASRATMYLMETFLQFENALIENAISIRSAVTLGNPPPAPIEYSASHFKKCRVHLPPFLLAVVLPTSTEMMKTALAQISSANAWDTICAGVLDFSRLNTLARSDLDPVTVIARGLVSKLSHERAGAGGLSPLIGVHHLQIEMVQDRKEWLQSFDGSKKIRDYPMNEQKRIKNLIHAGFLTLR